MLYWVTVSNEGLIETFFGSEGEAKAQAVKALYGPFFHRREAKGCVCNLTSTDKEVLKVAEKSRAKLNAPKVEAPAEEKKTEATTEAKTETPKPGRKKKTEAAS